MGSGGGTEVTTDAKAHRASESGVFRELPSLVLSWDTGGQVAEAETGE